ncbi:unnamed protein product [Prorocentrum cordatum]|uniref:JmjC domain-containing protein n=1 Tax=Prorocentrum cordatum TaxID=2364126 RepID=A0ABN9PF25_9DINO|nr:unnamed protein product [Polarella glacialis]
MHPDVRVYEAVQNPGEVIFVPSEWWHGALNMEDTVAVTQNYCGYDNFDLVWARTRRDREKLAFLWLNMRRFAPALHARALQLNRRDGALMRHERDGPDLILVLVRGQLLERLVQRRGVPPGPGAGARAARRRGGGAAVAAPPGAPLAGQGAAAALAEAPSGSPSGVGHGARQPGPARPRRRAAAARPRRGEAPGGGRPCLGGVPGAPRRVRGPGPRLQDTGSADFLAWTGMAF